MEDSSIVIESINLKKYFKVSKRSKGLPGTIANLFFPKCVVKEAVKDISFTIKRGESVGFIGANGAGKSTTIKILSGILYPDDGIVKCLGYVPYKQRKQYVAHIGVVFGQKSQLAWDLPVIDSFDLLKRIYKIPDNVYQKNVEMFTELLDMSSFIEQPVRQLSLGQRMRADIAAALLHSPEIVFFDEPTIGLDVVAKEHIREFVRYMNREQKVTMIFTKPLLSMDLFSDISEPENDLTIWKYSNNSAFYILSYDGEEKYYEVDLKKKSEFFSKELIAIKLNEEQNLEMEKVGEYVHILKSHVIYLWYTSE